MQSLVQSLQSNQVLLMDGAMGTELQRAGIGDGECYEAWNLTQPEKIRTIHQSYVDAGAEVLLSNTFQANPPGLARFYQDENLTPIIRAGLAHARAALPRSGWVLADIGPLSTVELKAVWPILNACHDADGLLLETFSDPAEVDVFVRANRSGLGPKKPVLASFTFDGATLRTFQDATPEKCARAAANMGVSALGVNCGRNLALSACVEILRRYRAITDLPLFARPNAGNPTTFTQPHEYTQTPEEMAAELPLLFEAGAVMVGGCCGTMPQHIRAFRSVVDAWNVRKG